MAEQKAAKAFIEASYNRLMNPYHFANLVKSEGAIPASMLHRVAVGWFMLNEIDYRYGIGDPITGDMASRIVHEVLNDYEELPNYNPSRGFEADSPDTRGTWADYESRHNPTFIRRGVDN